MDTKPQGFWTRWQRRLTSLPALFMIAAAIFLVSFLISSFPVGVNPLAPSPVKRVYFADNIDSGHELIIQRFNELHAGKIEVVPINLPFTKFNTNERKELIARNLRGRGSRIDVFSVDLIWVNRFTKWAEPLTPYFSPSFLDNMLPEVLRTSYVGDILYAIPLYTDIGALYYREDLILALPDGEAWNAKIKASISWEDLLELRQRYFSDRPLYVPQAANYEGLICNFNELLAESLMDSTGRAIRSLTDSLVLARVQFFVDMFAHGVFPEAALELTEDEAIRYALKHDIPFVRGWPTVNNENDPRFDPAAFSRLVIAPLPHFKGHDVGPVFGGWNMMLSKHSPVKEAAIRFMQFTASEQGQHIFYDVDGLLPVQKQFYEIEADNPRQNRLDFLRGMMEKGIHRPALNQYTFISDILAERLHEALSRELDVKTAMSLADKEIASVLKAQQSQ